MAHLKGRKLPDNLYDERLPYDYENRERGTIPPDTTRDPFRWRSEIAYKNVHRIVLRGYDTTELVEEGYGFVDFLFIEFQARIPLEQEMQMLDYLLILGLEDGLSSAAVAARIVGKSNTYLTQACGAAILTFGNSYGAYCTFGAMLDRHINMVEEKGMSTAEAAGLLVKENLGADHLGVSTLMLKDPAAKRIFARAEKLGVSGKYIAFMKEVVTAAQKTSSDAIDIDILGAIGAAMMDLGFSPEAAWAIMAITRSFAAGAHAIEEIEREESARLGEVLTPKEDYDGPAERPVPSLEDRAKHAKPAQAKTLQEWRDNIEEGKKLHGSGNLIEEEIDLP